MLDRRLENDFRSLGEVLQDLTKSPAGPRCFPANAVITQVFMWQIVGVLGLLVELFDVQLVDPLQPPSLLFENRKFVLDASRLLGTPMQQLNNEPDRDALLVEDTRPADTSTRLLFELFPIANLHTCVWAHQQRDRLRF